MSATGPIGPPFPTDQGPLPADDSDPQNTFSPQQDLDDAWNWVKGHTDDLGAQLGQIFDATQIKEKSLALLTKVIAFIVLGLFSVEEDIDKIFLKAEVDYYTKIVPDLEEISVELFDIILGIFQETLSGAPGDTTDFGSGPLAEFSAELFRSVISKFTLLPNAANPRDVGSGIQNQQYLLSQALELGVSQWFLDSASSHLGLGFLKTLSPLIYLISSAVNPQNAVRQAMDASYALLVRAPMTRDLNRKYPIKDLGITALAKLYLRGAIDQATYLDRALDSGLDNEQAQQLILETAKLLSEGQIAKLLNVGFITREDAVALLAQQGYQSAAVDAVLYLATHERFFKLQERVGEQAVTAWKKGRIDQTRLELLLDQLGYTKDEIALLEIEAEFVKTTQPRELDSSQVTAMFKRGILGLDDVINFLTNQGYSPDDVNRLVLLDFTKAEEETIRTQELIARLRVAAQQARVLAIAETKKSEAALAAAKTTLAKELDQAASELGQLRTRPGILGLLGQ